MARLRFDAVRGELSASIGTTDTVITSPGLARLGTVSSPDVALICLYATDGNGNVTNSENVYVTSHLSAQTYATVTRAGDGTIAQAWSANTTWSHGFGVADVADIESLTNAETTRATNAEAALSTSIAGVQTNLNAETTRATNAEALLAPKASPTFTGTATTPALAVSGFTGATTPTRYVGGVSGATPTTGVFQTGDYVIDVTGAVWICTAAGTPGTWTSIGSGSGVTSFNTRTGAVTLSKADVTGTGLTYTDVGADASGAASAAQTAAQTYADRYAGSAAGTASRPLAATDASVTNSRTPTSHASTHASAGSDPVTIAESQVTNLTTDLAAKAPLASPAFTGTPSLPTGTTGVTQTAGDNSTKIATTAYTDPKLAIASNLSDLNSSGTARFNIGQTQTTLAAAVAVSNQSGTFSAGTVTSARTVIDGYTLATGDYVLLTNQTTTSQNGLWQVTSSTNWARPAEFYTGGVVRGRSVKIMGGTYFAATDWVLNTNAGAVTIDTTAQSWTQVGGRGILFNGNVAAGTILSMPATLAAIVGISGLYGSVMPGQRPLKVTFSGTFNAMAASKTLYFGLGSGAIATPGSAACYSSYYVSLALATTTATVIDVMATIPTSSFTAGTLLSVGASGACSATTVNLNVASSAIQSYCIVEEA